MAAPYHVRLAVSQYGDQFRAELFTEDLGAELVAVLRHGEADVVRGGHGRASEWCEDTIQDAEATLPAGSRGLQPAPNYGARQGATGTDTADVGAG